MAKNNNIFFIFLLSLFFCLFTPALVLGWHGYVVKVLDGDSLIVRKGNRDYEVRLYGIDAPEYGQKYGEEAKRFTKAQTYKKTVTVEPKDVDRYGRIVAVVKSRGTLVNRKLVQDGLAWVYSRYCLDKTLCSAWGKEQKRAKAGARGLWKDKNPLPPWQWREKVRNN